MPLKRPKNNDLLLDMFQSYFYCFWESLGPWFHGATVGPYFCQCRRKLQTWEHLAPLGKLDSHPQRTIANPRQIAWNQRPNLLLSVCSLGRSVVRQKHEGRWTHTAAAAKVAQYEKAAGKVAQLWVPDAARTALICCACWNVIPKTGLLGASAIHKLPRANVIRRAGRCLNAVSFFIHQPSGSGVLDSFYFLVSVPWASVFLL